MDLLCEDLLSTQWDMHIHAGDEAAPISYIFFFAACKTVFEEGGGWGRIWRPLGMVLKDYPL